MQIEKREVGGGIKALHTFADEHELVMELTERPKAYGLSRWCARFKQVEIKGDGVLIGAHGDGDTQEAAIADYARRIEGHVLVFRAFHPERKEIQVPNDLTVDERAMGRR